MNTNTNAYLEGIDAKLEEHDKLIGHLDNALVVVEEYVAAIEEGLIGGTPRAREALIDLDMAGLASVMKAVTISGTYVFTATVELNDRVPVWELGEKSQSELEELYGEDIRNNGFEADDFETEVTDISIEVNPFN
jgi:hypothetical protein